MSRIKGNVASIKQVLIIKSREAMMSAAQIYNNPLITFKSESFIVLSNIAWTYLLHAYYRSIGIDYRYYETVGKKKRYSRTKTGEYKHWELLRCLNCNDNPLDASTSANLRFLIEIRNNIEHRFIKDIDEEIKGKIQASCINYNYYIKHFFGDKYGIDTELGIVIQFSEITPSQRDQLKGETHLPKNIHNIIVEFEKNLTDEEVSSPRYEYKIVYQPFCSNRKSDSDEVIRFVKYDGSVEPDKINVIKEVEKKKYLPKDIVDLMKNEGYVKFRMHEFTLLWKLKNARGNKEYSVNVGGRWFWYETWIPIVRAYCKENPQFKE